MEESMSMSGFCINKASTSASAGATGTKCGRWNPTSEQVKVLTDLFHSGLRTPSTDQIQKISSQLSFYGKIESKNVFYWFQNHKARERQKRRKVISVVDDNIDKDVFVLKQDHKKTTTVSSPKRYAEICHNNNHNNNWRHDDRVVSEPERVIETLQLFPLSSFGEESGSGKLRFHANHDQCCREKLDHPPLDLRLSFL